MADAPTPNTDADRDTEQNQDASHMASEALTAAQQAVNDLQSSGAEGEDESSEADAAGGEQVSGPNVDLPNFQQVLADVEASGIDLLHDVELHVKIELGRTHMLIEDVLRLAEGSVVELDKLAGDPVDVFVNDRLVARGEVLVLNDNFCVRVNEIVSTLEDPMMAVGPGTDEVAEETTGIQMPSQTGGSASEASGNEASGESEDAGGAEDSKT